MKSFLHTSTFIFSSLFIVGFLVVVSVITPEFARYQADIHLKQVTTTELLPLTPAVSNLKGADPESYRECSERSLSPTSYLTRTLWCRESIRYHYDKKPIADSAREDTLQKAATLDKLLVEKGWQPPSPDKTHTIVDAIPSKRIEAFHGDSIIFRKNVNDVRCLLKIQFSGPTDGISPGIISVNDFSCMREVRFFSPHIPQFTKQGFTPI